MHLQTALYAFSTCTFVQVIEVSFKPDPIRGLPLRIHQWLCLLDVKHKRIRGQLTLHLAFLFTSTVCLPCSVERGWRAWWVCPWMSHCSQAGAATWVHPPPRLPPAAPDQSHSGYAMGSQPCWTKYINWCIMVLLMDR